jgi:hypothetical protein
MASVSQREPESSVLDGMFDVTGQDDSLYAFAVPGQGVN